MYRFYDVLGFKLHFISSRYRSAMETVPPETNRSSKISLARRTGPGPLDANGHPHGGLANFLILWTNKIARET